MSTEPVLRGYLNTRLAAAYLGCAQNTLRELAKRGKVKSVRPLGKHFRFHKDWLDEFMQGAMPEKSLPSRLPPLVKDPAVKISADGKVSFDLERTTQAGKKVADRRKKRVNQHEEKSQ